MSSRDARAALVVVFVAAILIGLNATMLSLTLPTVVGDLGASPVQGTWMLLAYLVVAGAGLVLSGQLADCLDLAAVFRAGLVAFGGASLALMVTSDAAVFIAARAVQGAGSALMLSTVAAIVTISHSPERRRGAMGVYLAGFAIAQVSGPLIGGLVRSALGWRWLFVLGLLIAVGDVLLGRPRRPARCDGARSAVARAPRCRVRVPRADRRRAVRRARDAPQNPFRGMFETESATKPLCNRRLRPTFCVAITTDKAGEGFLRPGRERQQ